TTKNFGRSFYSLSCRYWFWIEMTASSPSLTNFAFLDEHDHLLVQLGMLAEKYFTDDPNTCILKLRQLAEALAQHLASRVGLLTSAQESQFDLIRRLQDE